MDKDIKSKNPIEGKIFKKEVKIGSYFAFLTSILIVAIVFLTITYVSRFVKIYLQITAAA